MVGTLRPLNTGMARAAEVLALVALGWIGACSNGSDAQSIDGAREVSAADRGGSGAANSGGAAMSSKDRFGTGNFGGATAPSVPQGELAWTMPAGWSELPASSMRVANFRVAGDAHSECYLTLLSGAAGGLAANVQRWRSQMSQAPLSDADISALEKIDFIGSSGVLVDIPGTWIGMNGTESGKDYRLIGMIAPHGDGFAFLKMVGPASVIGGQADAFRALVKSFHVASGPAPTQPGAAAPNISAPPSSTALTWVLPAGWRRAPDRPQRTATFFVGDGESVECYVTELPGDAGGPLANLNRWRKQLGRDELPESKLAEVPKIPMFDADAWFVTVDGTFTPMGGGEPIQDALLYGALWVRAEGSFFVKMVGPRARVEPAHDAFVAFVKSLKR